MLFIQHPDKNDGITHVLYDEILDAYTKRCLPSILYYYIEIISETDEVILENAYFVLSQQLACIKNNSLLYYSIKSEEIRKGHIHTDAHNFIYSEEVRKLRDESVKRETMRELEIKRKQKRVNKKNLKLSRKNRTL